MNRTHRTSLLATAVAGVALSLTASAQAQQMFFGEDDSTIDFDLTTGSLSGANYYNNATDTGGALPAGTLNLGNDATVTNATGETVEVISVRVGVAGNPNGPALPDGYVYPSFGTLNVTGGSVTTTGAGILSFSVGDGRTGVANFSGDAIVTVGGQLRVGVGGPNAPADATGTLTVSDNAVLTVAEFLQIGGEVMNGDMTVNGGTVTVNGGWLNVGNFAGSDNNSLTVNDGLVDLAGGLDIGFGENSSNNSVTVAGGTLNVAGDFLRVGGGANSTGNSFTQSGGAVNVTAVVNFDESVIIAGPAGSEGTYTLNAGEFNAAGAVQVGNFGAGTLTLAGGAFSAGEVNLANFTDSSGTLNVVGDDGTIAVLGDFTAGVGDSDITDATGGLATLSFVTDAEGVSTIDVVGDGDLLVGTATLADTTVINLDISGDATPDDVYNLIDASSILADLGAITFNGPSGYSLQVVAGGNGQILQAVIPEPTSLALLGLGGLTMLRRRR